MRSISSRLSALAGLAAAAAASMAGAQTGPADRTVSPVTVSPLPSMAIAKHPDAVVSVSGDAGDPRSGHVTVWPVGAFDLALDGRVTLNCLIDAHGLAEWCKVAGEAPPGENFGSAALALRPKLRLPPARGPAGPTASVMTINFTFPAPTRTVTGPGVFLPPVVKTPETLLAAPVWVAAPSFDDLARAYPARGGGVEGYTAAHCRVERTGALSGCYALTEDPANRGFEKAALSLTGKFRVAADLAAAPVRVAQWVDVPIRFAPPGARPRTVDAPTWLTGVDAKAAPKVFPPEAAAQGLTTGHGVARCTVAAGGAMSACAPETAEPDGLGFSEAAVRLASAMRMNLWSADGAPVEGGVVRIGIRLNLKAPAS